MSELDKACINECGANADISGALGISCTQILLLMFCYTFDTI